MNLRVRSVAVVGASGRGVSVIAQHSVGRIEMSDCASELNNLRCDVV